MWEKVTERIAGFIRETVRSAGAEGAVLGLSGGVDSATVAFLCTRALGKDRVLATIMPEKGVTKEEDVRDALELCEILGIRKKLIPIDPMLRAFLSNLDEANRLAVANLKPRIRMTINYYYANSLNYLVAGTGNKSELMIGYFTKHGDGAVDFLPIGDLYKTEVFELAKHLGVPERIIRKKPSAGLWEGQTDEDEIGMSYEMLDEILRGLESGEFEVLKEKFGEKVEEVLRMVRRAEHKRSPPPVAKVRDLIGVQFK